jgi:hypothetical protein
VNVEISIPTISSGRSSDSIGLRFCGNVVRKTIDLVTKREIDWSRKSAVPGIYKIVPTNYGEYHITGDDDLVAVPDAVVVGSLLAAE